MHGHWFAFLDDIDLLDRKEREVMRRHNDVLAGMGKERINKSYKLVTLQALLQIGALRSGADIAEIAWTAYRIVTGDPRLIADTRLREMPDPSSLESDAWREYWRKWPLAAWAGELPGESKVWFRIDGRRFVPTFQVAAHVGEPFDAMVEEPVDYWLARYLSKKDRDSQMEHAFRLKVIQAQGRPILMLDRERNPDLPAGEAQFIADGEVYTGNFVKIALNVAHRVGRSGNERGDLLRSWFGADAGQPGTAQYVDMVPSKLHWQMRPASTPGEAWLRPPAETS
jgi:hypothetical protein